MDMTTIKLMLPEFYEEKAQLDARKNELETTIDEKSKELSDLKAEYQKILANNFDDPQLEKNYDLQEKAKKSISQSFTRVCKCGTDCAPSTITIAPNECAISVNSLIGTT